MDLTPHATLRSWLLEVLDEHGGSLMRQDVLRLIQSRFGSRLTADDFLPQPSTGQPKWASRIGFQRIRMVEDGLLEPFVLGTTPRGLWTLTQSGRLAARSRH